MGRKKTDPFWNHVEIRSKDRWMCKFCRNEYPGHVSRIKAHMGQVKNRGIDICNKVDDDVREQALKALKLEPTERKEAMVEEITQRKVPENISSIPPFSGFNEWQDFILYNQNVPGHPSHDVMSQSLPLLADFPNVGTSSAAQHTQFQPTVVLPDSYIQHHRMNSMMDSAIVNFQPHNEGQPAGVGMLLPRTSNNFDERLGVLERKVKMLRKEEEEKEGELHHWLKKVNKIKIAYEIIEEERNEGKLPSLRQVNQLEIWIREVEGLGNLGVLTKALSSATHNNNHPPALITTKLIGRDKEMSEIWNYLVHDDILRVGIYGMGGVGKTEIAMHIYNKLLENECFDHVFWATMPRDFTIYEIQEVIGNAVHLDDILKEKNEKIRAAMLHRFLISKKKKSVLILDGLWRDFDFNDVGIPVTFHGLRLVITSRSLDVCRMMLCQAQIRIPLLNGLSEGFKIFSVKLGLERELPSELKEIATKLVLTCKGLPLYVIAIARRMRGVKDVCHWKDMLEKMEDPKERWKEMKHDVYDTLKLSYDSLDDHQLQQCLVFSAYYLSSRRCGRRDLIEFLVDVGLILRTGSRQKLFHEAHAILDKLESACLLDGDIEMHDSIREMAFNIRSDKVPHISHSAIGLKGILDEELWFEGLDKISLLIDGREESSNRSTNFSKISVLLSNGKLVELEKIPDRFLSSLSGLTILDLSESKIKEIPHSVSDLISLTALVLRHCCRLVQIPYIGKLTSLQKLDLYHCINLINLPEGLEYLVDLNYLDLFETGIENLPGSILANFKKLRYLSCRFSTVEELSLYAKMLTGEGPDAYDIHLGEMSFDEHERADGYSRAVAIGNCGDREEESHGDCISLPKNIQTLCADCWSNARMVLSHCDPLEDLEELALFRCRKFGVIFGDQNEGFVLSNSNASPFPNLKKLSVGSCFGVKHIFRPGLESGTTHPISHLTSLNIYMCHKIKRLLSHELSVHLCNLRILEVLGCQMLEELTDTYDELNGDLCMATPLPKLKMLSLVLLPELRSIGAISIGSSIEIVKVMKAPQIKRIPLQMPQLPNGQLAAPSSLKNITISSRDWWESLEWESQGVKDILQPYVQLSERDDTVALWGLLYSMSLGEMEVEEEEDDEGEAL